VAKIVGGAYEGRTLTYVRGKIHMTWTEGWSNKSVNVSPLVSGYYVADEAHRVAAGAGAAAAGLLLLGPLGLAGGLVAAKKRRLGVVTWRDGKQSVIEIKDKKVHETLVKLAVTHGASGP
jgi:hypothetical protein